MSDWSGAQQQRSTRRRAADLTIASDGSKSSSALAGGE
jgi:hypothetical protein